jgi:hypothetical protein
MAMPSTDAMRKPSSSVPKLSRKAEGSSPLRIISNADVEIAVG